MASKPRKRLVRPDREAVRKLIDDSCLPLEKFAAECGLSSQTLRKMASGAPVFRSSVVTMTENLKLKVKPGELLAGGGSREGPGEELWAALVGTWTGRIEQPHGPGGRPFRGALRIVLSRRGRGVSGRYRFTVGGTAHECAGGVEWLFERFFKFDAANPDDRMFNTFYFRINAARDRIVGRYVGFGPHTDGVIHGEASGTKAAPRWTRG